MILIVLTKLKFLSLCGVWKTLIFHDRRLKLTNGLSFLSALESDRCRLHVVTIEIIPTYIDAVRKTLF